MNPLPNQQQEAAIKAKIAEQQQADAIGKAAALQPLPGPLRDAFAIQQDIEVGPYKVRPFYDIDFEFLVEIGHPLAEMRAGKDLKTNDADLLPRGPKAWQLCWIMTHTIDDVEAALKDKVFEDKAKKEFGRKQIGALNSLAKAIAEQMTRYWETVIGYAANDGEEEAAKAKANPT